MPKRVLTLFALLAAASLLVLAGCGDDDDEGDGDQAAATTETEPAPTEATETEPPAQATGTTIKTGDSQFGSVVFDGDDQAIYYFDKEKSSTSECYGACAEAWPPVLTDGEPQAGKGVNAGKLGTTPRDDGTTQVTYAGRPLYYYAHESPGEVRCHNIDDFGGLWLAIQPDGEAVPI